MVTENNERENFWVKKFFTVQNIIIAIITVITAINAIYSTITKDKLNNAILRIDTAQRALNLQTTKLDNLLKKREFENNIKLEMYQEAKKAIGEDSIKQAATLLIINEMLKDDSAFLWQLKSIISRAPGIKNKIELFKKDQEFSEQQNSIPASTFTIDVFYLEEIVNEALPRAKKIVKLLSGRFPEYKVRLRLLPASINSQKGYRISANSMRFDKKEEPLARILRETIINEKIFQLEQPRLQLITFKTPKYISIFVRNM